MAEDRQHSLYLSKNKNFHVNTNIPCNNNSSWSWSSLFMRTNIEDFESSCKNNWKNICLWNIWKLQQVISWAGSSPFCTSRFGSIEVIITTHLQQQNQPEEWVSEWGVERKRAQLRAESINNKCDKATAVVTTVKHQKRRGSTKTKINHA